MVAGFISVRWPTSNRNRWPDCVGFRILVEHRQIVSDRVFELRSHPDFRLVRRALILSRLVRIPTQSGHRFRFDAGHRSETKPATIPR